MSRRVLLGKAGTDYGLFISKLGVDVINDSGTLCDKDLITRLGSERSSTYKLN